MAAHATRIQLRVSLALAASCCASRKAQRVSDMKVVTPMSSVLTCAIPEYSKDEPSTSPAMIPASRPNKRLPVSMTTNRLKKPVSAVHKREVHWCWPNASYAAAVAQYCSAGFSKYLRSLRRGVSQSPLATISRGISA